MAKVQDWLSQISEDVPTETEQEAEKHERNVGEHRESEKGKDAKDASLSIEKTKVGGNNAANLDLCKKKIAANGTERKTNTSAQAVDDRSEVEHDKSLENESKKESGVGIKNLSEKSVEEICKIVDKSKSCDSLSPRKTIPGCSQTLNSSQKDGAIEDEVVNLKFDVLVEDGMYH